MIVRGVTVIARRTVIARPMGIASRPTTLGHDRPDGGRLRSSDRPRGTLTGPRTAIGPRRDDDRPVAMTTARGVMPTVPRTVIARVVMMIAVLRRPPDGVTVTGRRTVTALVGMLIVPVVRRSSAA